MFFKLSVLALVFPFVLSLQLQALQDATSGGQTTIRWTNEAGDPSTFSIFLVNELFHNNFGVANNVQPASGSLALGLPSVPASDGYTLMAVDISDINKVFATSPTFSIGGEASTTASSTTSVSTSQSQSQSVSRSSSTGSRSTTVLSTTSSQFGSTLSNSNTGTSAASTSSGSGTPSSAASLPVRFSLNKGALSAVFLSAIAGAVVVAL